MELLALAVVVGAVLLGVTLQRTSGMGTGLVLSPTLVLAIGPVAGILLTNMTTVVSALFLTVAVRADIDWGRYARIAPAIVLGSVPAALLVYAVGSGWLEVIIGAVLLLSLAATPLLHRLTEVPPLPAGLVAGLLGGFLNTAVGVAAAAMLAYAQVTRWEQKAFAATLQPIFLTMGLTSVATKLLVGAVGEGQPPPWPLILAAIGSVPLGVLLGGAVARRVSARTARRVAVVVVVLGATATLLRGLGQVLGAPAP
ncbi:sulfite exporter TauE/SafE family protein [Brachybacterium fresconis]|uniref:Probable membrane transporter protein n=1 Tax=Brachybacterium fresconis TaxID=173363 RepID=A0ABS4YLN9_9MICO|nr:sulfite exporter TauE/SafE family protein [Brachybacterium fresconis]MBP2409664.1 putative membrane protein YfcA [Brachybacterium fresconis]